MRSLPIACCACCALALPLASAMAQNSVRKSRIVGVVGDSVNEAPLRGAEVLVSGVAATVTTDSLGRFTIDSVAPGSYQVGVFHPLLASLGITLATKPFVVGPDSAGVVHLAVPSVATLVHRYCGAKQTASAPSVIAGLTRDDGAFRLAGVLTGTQVLVARNLSFATAVEPINVTSREPIDVVVTLAPKINVLDPVLITARRDVALEKSGFNARKRTRYGHFITGEDISRRKPNNISDMLKNLSGVTVTHQPGGVVISGRSSARNSCTSVFIDGFEWRDLKAGDLDMIVNPDDVIGLEVYQPYDAPAQFQRFDRGCLTLMVWRQVRSKVKQ